MHITKPQKVLHLKKELAKVKPNLKGNYIITEKFEGWYVTIYYNAYTEQWDYPKSFNAKSAAERPVPSLMWTRDAIFSKLPKPKTSLTLIAEAYAYDTPFHILNGLLNRSAGNFDFKDVVFMIHDLVYTYDMAGSPQTAIERYKELKIFEKYFNTYSLRVVPIISISPYHEELWKFTFDTIAEQGGEGIVAKRENSLYSPGKRNSDLLKLKLECEIDALAIGLEEGIGEKGNLSLTLISRRKNGILIRTVISKHEDQRIFREDSSNVIGKVVTIKGMEEYEDGQIRQPVFSCIREDKTPQEID